MPRKQRRGSVVGLNRAAKAVGYETYEKYLQSSHWQQFQGLYRSEAKFPKRCVACEFPVYILHHIRYDHLGAESFADVIPVCSRCHLHLHKVHKKKNIPLKRPDIAFQVLFGWSRDKTQERFGAFRRLWWHMEREKTTNSPKKVMNPVDEDFFPVWKVLRSVVRYTEEGYPIDEVALMHRINEGKLRRFMKRYPDYFERLVSNVESARAPGQAHVPCGAVGAVDCESAQDSPGPDSGMGQERD
jgi:hypothetical protein